MEKTVTTPIVKQFRKVVNLLVRDMEITKEQAVELLLPGVLKGN
jgi:hypothetical protein